MRAQDLLIRAVLTFCSDVASHDLSAELEIRENRRRWYSDEEHASCWFATSEETAVVALHQIIANTLRSEEEITKEVEEDSENEMRANLEKDAKELAELAKLTPEEIAELAKLSPKERLELDDYVAELAEDGLDDVCIDCREAEAAELAEEEARQLVDEEAANLGQVIPIGSTRVH